MGRYDIPAVINFILAKTGHSKLTYIGASMGGTYNTSLSINLRLSNSIRFPGTTVFFVAMASHPELNDKIDAMFALGPVASLSATRDFHYTFIGNFLWRPLAASFEWIPEVKFSLFPLIHCPIIMTASVGKEIQEWAVYGPGITWRSYAKFHLQLEYADHRLVRQSHLPSIRVWPRQLGRGIDMTLRNSLELGDIPFPI